MTTIPAVTEEEISTAVAHYWRDRTQEGEQDAELSQEGKRGEVLSDSHMTEFGLILYEKLLEIGLPESAIRTDNSNRSSKVPGYFRPSKEWDLVIIQDGALVAAIELKSQGSSLGNNWNNRVEEAVGNAVDLRRAIDAGLIESPVRPWLGYIYVMEGRGTSSGADRFMPSPLGVADWFSQPTYAKRCEEMCLRLMDEGLYDGASFLLSDEEGGLDGDYTTPNPRLRFEDLSASFLKHVGVYLDEFGYRQPGLGNF